VTPAPAATSNAATNAIVVIPARYGSSRFPGKPLARQTGKFLIQHVVEQASKAKRASRVVVATDDQRIFDAVKGFGGEAVMTSHTHHSGTDRIAEVMRRGEFVQAEVVVNVQGDEPEIEPELIDELIRVTGEGAAPIATAAAAFANGREVESPNVVKVVTDKAGYALYFSRAVIPFDRDRITAGTPLLMAGGLYRKHLGIYAYRREALLALAGAPVCEMERVEKLEQLRALYLGLRIFVQNTEHAPHGVDTPEDYAAFVKRYSASFGKDEAREHARA
jgi:3-deoxy-manno-octulosonate cytidylyltransferase (CMP-KDO synthetase)